MISNTLAKAFFKFKKLSLSFLALNIFISIVEAAGLVSSLSLLKHLKGIDSNSQGLTIFNVSLSSLSFSSLLILVTILQLIQALGPWIKGRVMSQLRHQIILWWNDEIITSFQHSRWDTISQYKPAQFSHLLSFDLEKMGDVFFIALRLISTFFILVTYTGFLYFTFSTEVFGVMLILGLVLWGIKKLLPNPRASGQHLRGQSERLDQSLLHFFENHKSMAMRNPQATETILTEVRSHGLAWKNAFTVLLKSQWIQRVSTILISSFSLFYATQIAQIKLEQLLILAYVFYKLNPLAQQCLSDTQEWKQSSPSFARANEILSRLKTSAILYGSSEIIDGIHELECRDLGYGYPRQNEMILRDLSFVVKRGQLALITGHNGSGKTTLADLLCRLLEPTKGRIKINDTLLQELSLTSWSKQVHYLPQNPHLIRGQLKEQLTCHGANPDQLEPLLEKHPLKHWLNHFPQGLEQHLREDEPTLSGGMTKKISLLGALLSKKSLIILDEPTEHLDQKSREDLIHYLKHNKADSCWIIFSHDAIFNQIMDTTVSLH